MRKIDLPPFDRAAFADKYGPWAIIAGASEGTGACYAEQLAAMGIHLVLVSRRQEALDALGQRLATEHGVEYRAITANLTEQGAGSRLVEATADLDIGLYISNAGADGAGNSFFGEPVDRSLRLLTMNAANVLEAVQATVPSSCAQRQQRQHKHVSFSRATANSRSPVRVRRPLGGASFE